MKLKSLLLGSAAALALSTGAQAADPIGTFVSLDVCDALGISGLTISSSDNCLRISGDVRYEFWWGDYAPETPWIGGLDIDNNDGSNDWRSRLEYNLQFEATADSDAGPARAVIHFRARERFATGVEESSAHPLRAHQAYVQIGDTTRLSAGRKDTIRRQGNDVPFNFLGLVRSEDVDEGVTWSIPSTLGNHVIQLETSFGDGIAAGIAIEDLTNDGALVGYIEATGAWGGAHFSLIATDILTGSITNWAAHTGATVNFDGFRVRGAVAFDDTGFWNGLLSGEATFDLFTLAASVEATSDDELGFGASVGADITDDIAINLGFRWFDEDTSVANTEGWQAAVQVVAAVAENLDFSAELGVKDSYNLADPVPYIDLGLDYAPGGGFTAGVGFEANTLGGYKVSFETRKNF